jgi:hypothetical protein
MNFLSLPVDFRTGAKAAGLTSPLFDVLSSPQSTPAMSIIQEGARHVWVPFEICGDCVVVAQAENFGHSMSIYQVFGPYCGAHSSRLFELTNPCHPSSLLT